MCKQPATSHLETLSSASATSLFCHFQLLFSLALHAKLPQEWGVDVVAVHPGEVVTNVVRTATVAAEGLGQRPESKRGSCFSALSA